MLRFDFIPAREGVPLLCDVLELAGRAPEIPGPYTTSFVEITFLERGRGAHRELGHVPRASTSALAWSWSGGLFA